MTLTPTEREEHFFKAMVDAADGSTPEELEPTERKEHWYKGIIDAIETGGGGSGGGVLVASMNWETMTLNKTWQEIHDAMLSGGAVIQVTETNVDTVLRVYNSKGTYRVISVDDGMYAASSASGYPVLQQ